MAPMGLWTLFGRQRNGCRRVHWSHLKTCDFLLIPRWDLGKRSERQCALLGSLCGQSEGAKVWRRRVFGDSFSGERGGDNVCRQCALFDSFGGESGGVNVCRQLALFDTFYEFYGEGSDSGTGMLWRHFMNSTARARTRALACFGDIL